MIKLENLIRPNIWALSPYSCARNEFTGEASVFLDANENPYNQPFNRYPDPLQVQLKEKIAALKGVRPTQIMLGVGSDEPIDLIFRIFCEPAKDNVVAINPTYGMYGVCADINNVSYKQVNLNDDFTLDADKVLKACDKHTKVVFLCSPNNPTGNSLKRTEIEKIILGFEGIVVIDEAYIDFSNEPSWLASLDQYPNIIVLQTFSKAWGMAALRCGMAFASEEIIAFFNKVKYPYNLNLLTQEAVYKQVENVEQKNEWVKALLMERKSLIDALQALPLVKKIYPTDANFVLVKVDDANKIYKQLVDKGIIVRNRNTVTLCEGCLRITVGTPSENKQLLTALQQMV
ncbi:MAG: histidinol-phosphate transaminase [Paludibacteraceae bacterium]|jgi:histidinol-phosphate aminotransferase|nr:histidinol-phosphate transaminase [Paludibacteraceae bacterium]